MNKPKQYLFIAENIDGKEVKIFFTATTKAEAIAEAVKLYQRLFKKSGDTTIAYSLTRVNK